MFNDALFSLCVINHSGGHKKSKYCGKKKRHSIIQHHSELIYIKNTNSVCVFYKFNKRIDKSLEIHRHLKSIRLHFKYVFLSMTQIKHKFINKKSINIYEPKRRRDE